MKIKPWLKLIQRYPDGMSIYLAYMPKLVNDEPRYKWQLFARIDNDHTDTIPADLDAKAETRINAILNNEVDGVKFRKLIGNLDRINFNKLSRRHRKNRIKRRKATRARDLDLTGFKKVQT